MPETRNDDTATYAASVQHVSGVKPPAPLQLGKEARQDWIRWQEDWADYAVIHNVSAKPADVQLALFRTALGQEGKKLL